MAVALKRLFVIFPQGDAPAEREFLGRKIFSVPVPPLPFLMAGPSRPTPARTLSCAASGGYVAMSTDTSLLEEYLRSSESQAKALREKPGLLEAAQKVGGMGTGLFGYENEADTMRAAFEAAKNDPGASTNGIGPSVFPGLPGITGPEKNLRDWMDFSLLARLRQGRAILLFHRLCRQRQRGWPDAQGLRPHPPRAPEQSRPGLRPGSPRKVGAHSACAPHLQARWGENIQRPTSNIEHPKAALGPIIGSRAFEVGC